MPTVFNPPTESPAPSAEMLADRERILGLMYYFATHPLRAMRGGLQGRLDVAIRSGWSQSDLDNCMRRDSGL